MKKRSKILLSISGICTIIFATIIASGGVRESSLFDNSFDATNSYEINLTSDNAYAGSINEVKLTERDNPITFTFSNCSTKNDNFIKLNTNGYFKNTDPIHAIVSVTPKFAAEENGKLAIRASFDNTNWGSYAYLTNNVSFDFSTKPHYIEFKAVNNNVTIESINIEYECSYTPSTPVPGYKKVTEDLEDYSGEFLIVYEASSYAFNSGASEIDGKGNYYNVTIFNSKILPSTELNGAKVTIAKMTGGYSVKCSDGYYLDASSGGNGIGGYNNAYAQVFAYENGTTKIKSDYENSYLYFNTDTDRFTYSKSETTSLKPVSLYKYTDGTGDIDIPLYNVDLIVSDSKASSYAIGDKFSSFVNNGGLTVKIKNSQNIETLLSESEYTYKLFNGTTEIDPTVTFTSEGTYTVKVKYGNFTEQSYQITVSKVTLSSFEIVSSDAPSTYSTNSEKTINSVNFIFNNVGSSYTNGYMQCKKSSSYIYNSSAINGLKYITIDTGDKSWSGSVYYGTESNPTSNKISSETGKYTVPNGNSYFSLVTGSSVGYIKKITIEYEIASIDPTAISLPSTDTVGIGSTKTLSVSYTPANCNQNKEVTWESSNKNVATVNATTGLITGIAEGTTTITATSTFNSSLKATCSLTVTETTKDKWTILFYICGSDLESGSGHYATSDLNEIKSVANKPDNVNIVVEAGGSSSWGNTQNNCIDSNKLSRFHLGNGSYVSDEKITKASMSLGSTLQSFVEWGIQTYPADKIGLVLWNHGGAMDGVCFDENYSEDYQGLQSDEVASACTAAINSCNCGNKLEFIGYDACLMSVQDIAGKNAAFANYMIASEESESGYGWDYDKWIDNVYADDSTENILTEICDTFIAEQGSSSDQTLSWLKLSNWTAYETAWENLSSYLSTIITSSSTWNSFKTVVNKAKKYGYYDSSDYAQYPNWSLEYNNGYLYDIFDSQDFIDKMQADSTYKTNSTLQSFLTSCENALTGSNGLIGYNKCGTGAGKSYGLCMFCPLSGYNEIDVVYTTNMTTLTNWRNLCATYGSWCTE